MGKRGTLLIGEPSSSSLRADRICLRESSARVLYGFYKDSQKVLGWSDKGSFAVAIRIL